MVFSSGKYAYLIYAYTGQAHASTEICMGKHVEMFVQKS